MSEQPGNAVAKYPNGKPWEGNDVASNPSYGESGVQEDVKTFTGKDGGAREWESHPNPENKFTIDTLNPKKSR